MFTDDKVLCSDLVEPEVLQNLSYLRTNLPFYFVSALLDLDTLLYADVHVEAVIEIRVSSISSMD